MIPAYCNASQPCQSIGPNIRWKELWTQYYWSIDINGSQHTGAVVSTASKRENPPAG